MIRSRWKCSGGISLPLRELASMQGGYTGARPGRCRRRAFIRGREEAVLGNHFLFAEACIILASLGCASTRPRLQDIFVLLKDKGSVWFGCADNYIEFDDIRTVNRALCKKVGHPP